MEGENETAAADQKPTSVPGIPDDAVTWSWPINVEFGGQAFTSLNLREPTGAEWLRWSKLSGVEAQLMTLSVVGAIPEPAVRQIGTKTITQAMKFLDRFFG